MSKRKAIIFVDGNNFYHNLKATKINPRDINFSKLSEFICLYYGLELKESRYYNSIPDISDGDTMYYKHMNFLNELRKQGIKVITRKLKKIPEKKIKIEKGVDVLIACDMIRKTIIDKDCECCILISGDADFIPSMEIIKKVKYEAITCSVSIGHDSELKEGKFRYLILKKEDIIKNCLKY